MKQDVLTMRNRQAFAEARGVAPPVVQDGVANALRAAFRPPTTGMDRDLDRLLAQIR